MLLLLSTDVIFVNAMPLKVVEPLRLYRQIADQLHRAVAAGEYPPGSRLPGERDLARQLGVSRPSLREALIALEVQGVIEVRTGSGIYVLERARARGARQSRQALPALKPEWSPMQLMRARELVEGEVAALAARQARKADIAAMQEALDDMRAEATAVQGPRRGDEAFHNAIAQACGNEVLRDTVRQYEHARYAPIFTRLGGYFETRTSWGAAIREHEAVLAAIRARDAEAARAAMHLHLRRAGKRYTVTWQRARQFET